MKTEKKMYLLERTLEDLKKTELQWENYVVLHINHYLDNSLYFTEKLGEIFGKVVFVGTPYYSCANGEHAFFPCYYAEPADTGYRLFHNGKQMGRFSCDFTSACECLIENALFYEIFPELERGKKLLILEDGGFFGSKTEKWIEKYPILKDKIVGDVEQTMSGARKIIENIKQNGCYYSYASVARSHMKMDVESNFIAHRIVGELEHLLENMGNFLDFRTILLLGYGIIGRVVARDLLIHNCRIFVYDISKKIRKTAYQEGLEVIDNIGSDCFRKDCIVLGTTGNASFTKAMFEQFLQSPAQNLYLASGSSGVIEFEEYRTILKDPEKNIKGLYLIEKEKKEKYSKYRFRYQEKEKIVYLFVEGMPLNFGTNSGRSLPYGVIDFIFTEMLLMGVWLCLKEGTLKKDFYLIGRQKIKEAINEKKLYKEWCMTYDLWERNNLSHPQKEYLCRKAMGRKNMDEKSM